MRDIIAGITAIARAEEEARGHEAQERCGVVLADGKGFKLVELANISTKPQDYFRMDPEEYHRIDAEHGVVAVWHTHPNEDAEPSPGDRVNIEALGVPCHIVSWPQGHHSYTVPCGYEAPYEGRPFVHAVLDCYAIIRDWYGREWKIHLEDFARAEEWWNDPQGPDLYVDNFASQGFYQLPQGSKDFQVGDVLLMQIMADRTNHGAIYLGDGKILHHVYGRPSEVTVFGGYWLQSLTHHLRHESRRE